MLGKIWRGLRKQEGPEWENFRIGDVVRLKHTNPYKGTLSADGEYIVQSAGTKWIWVRTDNRTVGGFLSVAFELAKNPIHKGTVNRWSQKWQTRRQLRLAEMRRRHRDRKQRVADCHANAEEYEMTIKGQELLNGAT